jgi:hypothetical protein
LSWPVEFQVAVEAGYWVVSEGGKVYSKEEIAGLGYLAENFLRKVGMFRYYLCTKAGVPRSQVHVIGVFQMTLL